MNPREKVEIIDKALRLLDEAYSVMDAVMTSGQRFLLNQLTEQWEDLRSRSVAS